MKENSILYEDLLLYKDRLQLNDVKIVSMGGVDKKNDKIFKKILSDEKEMAVFLCQFLKLKIKPNELEKYKNSFITQKYKSKESDIVYKNKNKDVYYLVEQQSKIDKNMPRRILRYCDELIEEIKEERKMKLYENPIIVPIVLYTGKKDWKIALNFADTQIPREKEYTDYLINVKYKLIDSKKYSEKELKRNNSRIGIMMLMENQKDSRTLKKSIIDIIEETKDEEKIEWLKEVTLYILSDVLKPNEREEILELIEERKKNDMDEWIERIKRNDEKQRQKLIKEAVMKIVKNMILNNEDDEKILKYADITQNELEKIKRKCK